MAFWVQITPGSNDPIYKQIVDQIRQMIAKGHLTVGQKLPAVRVLAAELVVNPNTVARAYALLEQEGIVVTKTGAGTFVSNPKLKGSNADLNIMVERMDGIIARGLNLGKSGKELLEIFRARVESFDNQNRDMK